MDVCTQTPEPPVEGWKATAEGMGLDTKEGVVGFTPFSELYVGRMAMMGFLAGSTMELATGHPILEQIGLMSDSQPDQVSVCLCVSGPHGGWDNSPPQSSSI